MYTATRRTLESFPRHGEKRKCANLNLRRAVMRDAPPDQHRAPRPSSTTHTCASARAQPRVSLTDIPTTSLPTPRRSLTRDPLLTHTTIHTQTHIRPASIHTCTTPQPRMPLTHASHIPTTAGSRAHTTCTSSVSHYTPPTADPRSHTGPHTLRPTPKLPKAHLHRHARSHTHHDKPTPTTHSLPHSAPPASYSPAYLDLARHDTRSALLPRSHTAQTSPQPHAAPHPSPSHPHAPCL